MKRTQYISNHFGTKWIFWHLQTSCKLSLRNCFDSHMYFHLSTWVHVIIPTKLMWELRIPISISFFKTYELCAFFDILYCCATSMYCKPSVHDELTVYDAPRWKESSSICRDALFSAELGPYYWTRISANNFFHYYCTPEDVLDAR